MISALSPAGDRESWKREIGERMRPIDTSLLGSLSISPKTPKSAILLVLISSSRLNNVSTPTWTRLSRFIISLSERLCCHITPNHMYISLEDLGRWMNFLNWLSWFKPVRSQGYQSCLSEKNFGHHCLNGSSIRSTKISMPSTKKTWRSTISLIVLKKHTRSSKNPPSAQILGEPK